MERTVERHYRMGIVVILGLLAAVAAAAAFAVRKNSDREIQRGLFDEWEDHLGI